MNVAAGTRRAFSFPLSPALVRTAWKEYRMLRGFWLGVAALALLEMFGVATLVHYFARPEWMFVSAWAAAALYAVGATTTLFAVEREEKTDQFLQLLPRRRRELLFGKLGTAALSSAALAAVLLVAGRLLADEWPAAERMGPLAAIGGTAVVQALAWGLLASLWIRHPLFAAVAAIAAASIATQAATSVSMVDAGAFVLETYRTAVPACLAFAALALALGIRAGLRWLDPPQSRSRSDAPNAVDGAFATPAVGVAGSRTVSKFRSFKRLVWQTWRSDWKALAAVIPLGVLMMFADNALLTGRYLAGSLPAITLLFIPAMCGALAFRSDQRGRQFRFLADHAAPPRQVWLARHAIWMLPVVVFATCGTVAAWQRIVVHGMSNNLDTLLRSNRDVPVNHVTTLFDLVRPVFVRIVVLIWAGTLTAYGLGQLFSMLMSSTVLAGFAALVCSILVAGWCFAIAAWELPGAVLVAPLAVASMAASLAYCRPWLTERPGVRPLVAPAGLMAITVAGLAWALPTMRLAQVDDSQVVYRFQQETIEDAVIRWQREEADARATAERYGRVASDLAHWRPAEPDPTDVAPWDELIRGSFEKAMGLGHSAINNDQSETAADREWIDGFLAANQQPLEDLGEISRSPHCRFPAYETGAGAPTLELAGWLSRDAQRQITAGDLDRAWQRIAAMRRLLIHAVQYQYDVAYADGIMFQVQCRYRERLAEWAAAPGQSRDRLERAIGDLHGAMDLIPPARDMFVAEHVTRLDVINGKELSSSLARARNRGSIGGLTYYANMLPWERERARLALEAIANARIDFADALTPQFDVAGGAWWTTTSSPREFQSYLRAAFANYGTGGERRPNDIPIGHWNSGDRLAQRAKLLDHCNTSFLAAAEFRTCTPESPALSAYLTYRAWLLAEVQWLALMAFQLDHGTYPRSLHELTPDYLPRGVPFDPFTLEPFQYRPDGFKLSGPKAGELNSRILGIPGADELIPAGTPLLWSVGPGYMEPTEIHQIIPPPSPDPYGGDGAPYGGTADGGGYGGLDREFVPESMIFSLTGQAAPATDPILMVLPPAEETADVESKADAGDEPGENAEQEASSR